MSSSPDSEGKARKENQGKARKENQGTEVRAEEESRVVTYANS